MTDRRLRHLQDQLAAIDGSLRAIAAQAPDLHSLAYERTGSPDRVKVSGGGQRGVEHHGNEQAQELWHRLERLADELLPRARLLEECAARCLARGRSGRGIAAEVERRGGQVGGTTASNPVRLSKTQ